jgi:putative SOS response-associated peptidase YedK
MVAAAIPSIPTAIIRLALRTLEDVLAQAEVGAVEPSWGVRLALDCLVMAGIARAEERTAFAEHMSDPATWDQFGHHARYVRSLMLRGQLDRWYKAARLPEPDIQTRVRWARAYAPEIVDAAIGTPHHPSMCNRYTPGDRHRIEQHFSARPLREFNAGPAIVHPRDPGWVVRLVEGAPVLDQMTWGFPVVLRGKRNQLLKPRPVNNARFDKLGGFWARWAAYPEQRCLIPATRFAEAIGAPGHMYTAWLSLRDEPMFAWAGLWRESDEWGACYSGVMTDAALGLHDIHDRCPVILARDDWQTWLTAPFKDLARFDQPLPAERFAVERTNVLWKDGGEPASPGN